MIHALDRLRKWAPLNQFSISSLHYEDTHPQQAFLDIYAKWNGSLPKRIRDSLMNAVLVGQTHGVEKQVQTLTPFFQHVEQRIKQRLGKGYVVRITGATAKKTQGFSTRSDSGFLSTRLGLKITIQPPDALPRQHKGLRQRGIWFEQTED
ncbi:hypothetical protein HY994_01200 [Candidatus Micrarchaeota archaeon]|nr:hypothetical protein [Candidatus Micrarchaeota archaeon]